MIKIQHYSHVIVVGVLVAFVLIIGIGMLTYEVSRSHDKIANLNNQVNQLRETSDLCTTSECIQSAAWLLESMDQTVNPCEDFYEFACGKWSKQNRMPESQTRWNTMNILSDRIVLIIKDILNEPSSIQDAKSINSSREMYSACMNAGAIEELGLKPLVEFLSQYGHWPMASNNWTESDFDLIRTASELQSNYGVGYLINIYNYIDSNNSARSIIYMDQPALGLPRSTLVNGRDNSSRAALQAYSTFIKQCAMLIAAHYNLQVNESDISADVGDMLQFETQLAEITTRAEDRRDQSRMYNRMSLSDLQEWTDQVNTTNEYSKVNWTQFISDIYSSVNISISSDESIVVVEKQFLQRLIALLDQTPQRVIANYIHWRLILELATETNQQMNMLAYQFHKVLYGEVAPQARWKWCSNKVNNFMGFAISSKYVNQSFDHQAKLEAEEMISNLHKAFQQLVYESSWMDSQTRQKALEKASVMQQFVAYPQWITNNTALDAYYRGVETSAAAHFDNIVNFAKFATHESLKGLRKFTDRSVWITFPSIVNAYYSFQLNSITFPAAILQPPFFWKGRLSAMNYGSIGVVIGHEITHGFDDQGRQSDKDGHTASWWTDATLAKYLQGAQCFIEQYGNYSLPQFAGTNASQLNGVNCQGENIADNGGLRQAYRAYSNFVAMNGAEQRLPGLEKYSPNQLFFIAYANIWCGQETKERLMYDVMTGVHSPGRFRVMGPLSNSWDFAQQFQCPVGPMSRMNKCILW